MLSANKDLPRPLKLIAMQPGNRLCTRKVNFVMPLVSVCITKLWSAHCCSVATCRPAIKAQDFVDTSEMKWGFEIATRWDILKNTYIEWNLFRVRTIVKWDNHSYFKNAVSSVILSRSSVTRSDKYDFPEAFQKPCKAWVNQKERMQVDRYTAGIYNTINT